MSEAFEELRESLRRAPLPEGSNLVVAVSGGPDSVALLHAVDSLRAERSWEVLVGHVNHGLRTDAGGDEAFVRDLAMALGLPVAVARVDVRQRATAHGVSLEDAARDLRYAALERMRASKGLVLTGHTLDDQAETVLLNLLRGSGSRGLAAMRVQRGAIVRPFLDIPRSTIETALQAKGIHARTDASNRDERFRRNFLRHKVMPHLRDVQPGVVNVLARTARLLGDEADFIESEATRALERIRVDRQEAVAGARGAYLALHPALRRAVLRLSLLELVGDGQQFEERHIVALDRAIESGTKLAQPLPRSVTLDVSRSAFALHTGGTVSAPTIAPTSLTVPGVAELPVGVLSVDSREACDEDVARLLTVCGPLTALLDADEVGPEIIVRGRRPGDRLVPLGGSGRRKVQDVLVDRKIPREERDSIPIVEAHGAILWIPGVVVARAAAIGPGTKRVIFLRWAPISS